MGLLSFISVKLLREEIAISELCEIFANFGRWYENFINIPNHNSQAKVTILSLRTKKIEISDIHNQYFSFLRTDGEMRKEIYSFRP